MVIAKTQIRSRVEADNAQREKKIAQLNDFIARFSAGTRVEPGESRRKEVERLQTTELARSNIQRPYIKFTMNRPSGRVALEFTDVTKALRRPRRSIDDFSAIVNRGEKIVLVGRNGVGKTTLLKALLADAPGRRPRRRATSTRGTRPLGPRGVDRLLPAGSHRRDREGHDRGRVAAPVRSGRRRARTSTACSGRCCSAAKKA